ncbi:hypothetical protein HDU93_002929 [Gonapodya sp. JEL0774]|nr:hypothetical protein HDU93_002929 [Gonapodya sp. JEL0774]
MHASGDSSTPADRRFYLRIYLPPDAKSSKPLVDGQPWFFDKDWTPGKIIDRLAATYNIPNPNATERDESKVP